MQRKWLDYVKPFADEVYTDEIGNAYAVINPEASFKVLIAGHCDEIGMLVKRIDENGFVYVEKLGGISHKPAIGMKVTVLGSKGAVTGVVGASAEHHGGVKEDAEFHDLYIDFGASSRDEMLQYVQIGDPAVYKRAPELLLDERLSGRGLDNRTGAFIVAEVIRGLAGKKPAVGVVAASTVNEETNMGGAYFAASRIQPNAAIAVDVTFATDYPDVDTSKHGEIGLDLGPVLAKGAPIHKKLNAWLEESAHRLDIPLQYELTPRRTGTDADQMRLTGKGVPVALVSLPLRYMHSPVETVSLHDTELEIALISNMLSQLTGQENLRPIEA